MPISADRFESMADEEEDPTPGTNGHEILSFLEAHADEAFTQSEIVDATGISRGSVGPTLTRLREAGHVDHRGMYWRVSDHARSVDAAAGHANEVAASHEGEPMAHDEWQEHAVDPRDDRNAYRAGDVFWAPDPFRGGSNPRLWLVLAARGLPYPGEEYLCAALTTSDLPANHEIGEAWLAGRDPEKTSYCSPWVLATIKHRAVANPQGNVSKAFTDRMTDRSVDFLRG